MSPGTHFVSDDLVPDADTSSLASNRPFAEFEIENRSFADLFPDLDLHKGADTDAAVTRALAVAGDKSAAIHRDGPNPVLILKTLEWVFSGEPPESVREEIRGRVVRHIRELALAEEADRWTWMWGVLAAACTAPDLTSENWKVGSADSTIEGRGSTQRQDRPVQARIALISKHPDAVTEVATHLAELGYAAVILSTSARSCGWGGPVPVVALRGDDRDILPWFGHVDLVVQADGGHLSTWIDAKSVVHIDPAEFAEQQLARILAALGVSGAPSRRRVVALIELTSWGGGAETVALHILRQLDRTRYLPVILTLWDARHLTSKVTDIPCIWVDAFVGDQNVPHMSSETTSSDHTLRQQVHQTIGDHWRAAAGIRGALAALGPDVAVIASMEHAIVSTWLAQMHLNAPFIAWIHNIESIYLPMIYPEPKVAQESWAFASACKASQVVVSPTRYCADDLATNLGVHPSHVVTVNNPQNCSRIRRASFIADPEAEAIRAEAAFLFVHVGRFAPEKNHDLLVDAASRLSKRGYDFQLICIGTGNEQERIAASITYHGLCERVRPIGARANPYPIMARADAFVLSSDIEAFGMVLTEAMACGVPIISTDCIGGVREVLEDGRCGLLVPPNDPEAMSEAMSRLMTDEVLRQNLVRSGYRRCDDMDVKKFARHWERLIDSCARSNPGIDRPLADRALEHRVGGLMTPPFTEC